MKRKMTTAKEDVTQMTIDAELIVIIIEISKITKLKLKKDQKTIKLMII